jgi:hypothetical protein
MSCSLINEVSTLYFLKITLVLFPTSSLDEKILKTVSVYNIYIFVFVLTFKFLLAYNSYTKGYMVIFTYMLTMQLRFTPSIVLPPYSSPPCKYHFNTFQSSIFRSENKIYPPYSPTFTLSLCLSPSHWCWNLEKPTLPSCPSFFPPVLLCLMG